MDRYESTIFHIRYTFVIKSNNKVSEILSVKEGDH